MKTLKHILDLILRLAIIVFLTIVGFGCGYQSIQVTDENQDSPSLSPGNGRPPSSINNRIIRHPRLSIGASTVSGNYFKARISLRPNVSSSSGSSVYVK